MSHTPYDALLAALLDAWTRNNTILVNLMRAIPDGAFDLRPASTSPSIGGLFVHMHYCRLSFVADDAPESATPLPDGEWRTERDRDQLAHCLEESAQTVREAIVSRLHASRPMDQHHNHPTLVIQHMIWHEGYHHGQIKLALKLAEQGLADEDIGRVTGVSGWTRPELQSAGPPASVFFCHSPLCPA